MQQRISVLIGAENKCVGTLVFDDTRPTNVARLWAP